MTRRLTRRRAITEALTGGTLLRCLVSTGGLPLALAACGNESGSQDRAHGGSTLSQTWIDRRGDGQLQPGPGEPFVHRTELGRAAAPATVLATLAHVTDAHVIDASSPARVTFLDRLGSPFQSTFRPQEALTAQVLAGAAAAVRAVAPQIVIQGGDLIDNAQSNELDRALTLLYGGHIDPGSGRDGYFGVQSASDTDPFYYRPDVDSPRYPGLLRQATHPFITTGIGAPVLPVLGDHDALVAGELVPTPLTRALAVGDRALWDLPPGLAVPRGTRRVLLTSPDGPPQPALVDELLTKALSGPTVAVPADPGRREVSFAEVVGRLAANTPGHPRTRSGRLDYAVDVGPHLRLIVLDLVRRRGGSGGLVSPGQGQWLQRQLANAGDRHLIVISHQPLTTSAGGESLLALLDGAPKLIAVLSGHTHRNEIVPRPTRTGGYWLISTASLIDYPQQARALRVVATDAGSLAIQTWMLDHAYPGDLGTIARQLSYLDAEGGRPHGFTGSRADRNALLYLRR
jgi:3',5'-cyclic AMP phosphodiesterase CpdA